jgi:hypothetical protein
MTLINYSKTMNNFICLRFLNSVFSSLQLDGWQGAKRKMESKFWTPTALGEKAWWDMQDGSLSLYTSGSKKHCFFLKDVHSPLYIAIRKSFVMFNKLSQK